MKRLFAFRGTADRAVFWTSILLSFFVAAVFSLLGFVVLALWGKLPGVFDAVTLMLKVVTASLGISWLCVATRRARDIGWSPWMALLAFLLPFNLVVLPILFIRRSKIATKP